ncbi:MAG TPA: hypothetical protein DEB37_17895 [Lysinibacillus sp.]|nr:hypothetical protein [Lysinibacillus sp.]
MNYDIKILGAEEDNGAIEFDRLGFLTRSTKDIATKALMLQLKGFSGIKPNKNLKNSLSIYLESVKGNPKEGTNLTLNTSKFEDTIKGLQVEFFRPTEEVLQLTPMALVIKAFNSALNDSSDEIDLDRPLLKSLLSFKGNFVNNNEIFYLSNRGTVPEVKLTKDDFKRITSLEEKIPQSQKVIVNGLLDELKISKGKLGLETDKGLVNVFSDDDELVLSIMDLMGKEITISGIANYKPNGELSFIQIQDYGIPGKGDKFFSTKPNSLTAHQQLLFEIKKTKKGNAVNALKNLSGILKDDINDEQFKEMLKDIHR